MKWIPFPCDMAIDKQEKQEQIVGNHAGPGADETHIEEANADKCTDNADKPHADHIVDERFTGFTHPLHKAFYNDGITIERFSDCHHS